LERASSGAHANAMSKRGESLESPRMFEHDFLDFFSRCHPAVVAVIYVPGVLVAAYYSIQRSGVSTGATAVLIACGFAFWTFAEYWLHRLVFHWLGTSSFGKRLHFLLHGVHHEWPRDKYRLVMPPGASLPLYVAFLGLFTVGLGRFAWGFHAGFVAGYLFYDLTHYWLHHGTPRTRYGRRLRRNHMLHHFKEPSSHFAVSNLVWDRVFRGTENARVSSKSDPVSHAKK
jgi:sterol desaturase/sphingolipid hydroxylase (fatty acid hydroxylase superfamily)